MPPESGGICGRLTPDLPLGYLQGGDGPGDGSGGSLGWFRRPGRLVGRSNLWGPGPGRARLGETGRQEPKLARLYSG